MPPVQGCDEDFWEMSRLTLSERGFAPALMVSAAIHAAFLPVLISFASGSGPMLVQPAGETIIEAFLVSGPIAEAGKPALPVRKRREAAVPPAVAKAPPPKVQPQAAPVEKEEIKPLTDIRPSSEKHGEGDTPVALPAPVSLASTALFPEVGDPSATHPAGIAVSGRGSGEFSGGKVGDVSKPQGEGMERTLHRESGAWLAENADAVPRYAENARPDYPQLARLRGYQGVVVLLVEVLADGRAGRVEIRRSAGHDILDRAALEAVRTWKFEPGRREGRAVTMSVEVPVRFVLRGGPALVRNENR